MRFVLRTDRLLLRPPGVADVRYFVPLLNETDMRRAMTRLPHPYTDEDGYDFVLRAAEERLSGKAYAFGIFRSDDHAVMGACGLYRRSDEPGAFEFRYWLGKNYSGLGYATEAARALRDFAFSELGARRLVSGWVSDGGASTLGLESLGFSPPEDRGVACHMVKAAHPDPHSAKCL